MDAVDLPHNFLQHEEAEEIVENLLPEEWVVEQDHEQAQKYLIGEETGEQNYIQFAPDESVYIQLEDGDEQYFDNQNLDNMYHSPEEIEYEDANSVEFDFDEDVLQIPPVQNRKRKLTIVECEFCGTLLKHPSKIKAHMRTHTGEKPFHCTICDARFTQRVPMLNHVKRHEGNMPYKCSFCDKNFVNCSQKKAHELRHQGLKRRGSPKPHLKPPKRRIPSIFDSGVIDEEHSAQSFANTSIVTVDWHPLFEQRRQPLSIDASKRIDEVIDAVLASSSVKKKKQQNSRPPHEVNCPTCGITLRHASKIQEHMRIHTGEKPFNCTICDLRFARMYSLKMHMARKHTAGRQIGCSWGCGAHFVSVGSRNEHERIVHSGFKRYLCNAPGCNRLFSRRVYLTAHSVKDHNGIQGSNLDQDEVVAEETNQQLEQAEATTSSEFVEQEFGSFELREESLLLDEEADIPRSDIIDEEENEGYATYVTEDDVHLYKLTTTIEDITKLQEGNTTGNVELSGQPVALTKTEEGKAVETLKNMWTCDGRMFKAEPDTSGEFIEYQHVEDGHILEDPEPDGLVDADGAVIQAAEEYVYVKVDPEGYLPAETQKRRYTMKRRAQAKVYFCTVCNKSFKYPSKIQEHMRRHTGEKPYSCQICGASFSQNHVLKAHLSTHQDEKPFKCSYCDRCFATKTHRNTHEKATHSGQYQDSRKSQPSTSRGSEEDNDTVYYACPFEECVFQSPIRREVEIHLVETHDEEYDLTQEEEPPDLWAEYSEDIQQEPLHLIDDGYEVYTGEVAQHEDLGFGVAVSSESQALEPVLEGNSVSSTVQETEIETSPPYELQVSQLKKAQLEIIMDQYPIDLEYEGAVYEGEGNGTVQVFVNPRPPRRGKQIEQTPVAKELVDIDIRTIEMVKPRPQGRKDTQKRDKPVRNLDWIIDAVASGQDVSHASPHRRKKPVMHTCQYCGKVDKYPSKIEAHMRTHTGEKPYKCDICGMTFSQRTPMRLHMRRHLDEKPYVCSIEGCNESFVSGALRNQHVNKKHLKQKKYVCIKGCGRCFASWKNQRIHEGKCGYIRDDPVFRQLLYEQNQLEDEYDDEHILDDEDSVSQINNNLSEHYVDNIHSVLREEYIENTSKLQ